MTRRHMRDLVTNDCGQLMLSLGNFEDPRKYADLATRHRERIDGVGLEDRHLPFEVAVFWRQFHDHCLCHAVDVIDLRPVRFERHVRFHFRELASGFDRQLLVVFENYL